MGLIVLTLFGCDSVISSQGSVSFLNHYKMIFYLNSLVDVKVSCTVISWSRASRKVIKKVASGIWMAWVDEFKVATTKILHEIVFVWSLNSKKNNVFLKDGFLKMLNGIGTAGQHSW